MPIDISNIPKHIAIIMDGNRRWARKQGLGVLNGHNFVVDKVIEPLIEYCGNLGIENLTLWAFSTENWNRDKQEVDGIMELFKRALFEKVTKFIQKGARLRIIGDMSRFTPEIQRGMQEAIESSSKNTKITVTFALNYGGRDEIIRAVKKMIKNDNEITEKNLISNLDTVGMPDPELIIRTGGEQRLSGFLAWQATYSELYFTETLMPDFTTLECEKALEEYQKRQRRFGK